MSDEVEQQGEGGEVEEAPDALAPWREFIDFEQADPQSTRQRLEYVNRLLDPAEHEQALQDSLREWGYIPKDATLEDIRMATYGGQRDSEDSLEFEDDDEGFVQPQQQGVTAEQMKQLLAEQQAAFDAKLEQRLTTERVMLSLTNQMESLTNEEGLSDKERDFVWRRVQERLSAGQVQDPSKVVRETWKEELDFFQARQARELEKQKKEPPQTFRFRGEAPSPRADRGNYAPGLKGTMQRTAEAMGIDMSELE